MSDFQAKYVIIIIPPKDIYARKRSPRRNARGLKEQLDNNAKSIFKKGPMYTGLCTRNLTSLPDYDLRQESQGNSGLWAYRTLPGRTYCISLTELYIVMAKYHLAAIQRVPS